MKERAVLPEGNHTGTDTLADEKVGSGTRLVDAFNRKSGQFRRFRFVGCDVITERKDPIVQRRGGGRVEDRRDVSGASVSFCCFAVF